MRTLLSGGLALAFLSMVVAQDATCGSGESETTVTIGNGDSYKYKTSASGKYKHNVNCVVNYLMDETCAEMKFSCKKINIKNKNKKICNKGDTLVISTENEEKLVCGNKKKFVFTSTSDMVVEFISDGKKKGAGAKGCKVTCSKPATASTAAPTTAAPTGSPGGNGTGGAGGYSKAWLRGEGPGAHVHEGIQFADKSGWVGIGELLPAEGQTAQNFKVMIRAVDNAAATLWTAQLGDDHQQSSQNSYSVGLSVVEGGGSLYAGVGLWQQASSQQAPAVMSLNPATGAVLWTTVLGQGQSGHGAVRSCIMDGSEIVCAGYVNDFEPGFKFVADEAKPAVWRLDSSGGLVTEKILNVEGLGQIAKIRSDPAGGFIACSTGWGVVGGNDVYVVGLVKLSASLEA